MKHYEKLNEYLSNTMILNIKLHNLHWNVVGKQFVQIHEFTESVYEDMFEKFDEVAEIMKMKGVQPLAKTADYLEKASIKEVDGDRFSREEVLAIVKEDLEKMKKLATEIRNEADEDGDFEVVAAFEDHVAGYSKNLWFLRAMEG